MSSWWIVPAGAILILAALSSCVTTEPTLAPVPPPSPPARVQAPVADEAKSRILGYLDSIIVPEFILEDTEFQVAFSFLAQKAMELDNPNSRLRGISFFAEQIMQLPPMTYRAENATLSKLLADLAVLYGVEIHVTSVGIVATRPSEGPFPNFKAQAGAIYKTYSARKE